MANVTKVTRPVYVKYTNQSSVEATVLSAVLFNVMSHSEQLSLDIISVVFP